MTVRFHRKGSDPALDRAPLTQWQRERLGGPILPMEPARASWWPRWMGRHK